LRAHWDKCLRSTESALPHDRITDVVKYHV
jgi:hypothetical protein